MMASFHRWIAWLFAAALTLTAGGVAAQGATRLVLKGYDPVDYFTEGKPVKGHARYA